MSQFEIIIDRDKMLTGECEKMNEKCDFCGTGDGSHSAECVDTGGKGYGVKAAIKYADSLDWSPLATDRERMEKAESQVQQIRAALGRCKETLETGAVIYNDLRLRRDIEAILSTKK